MNEVTQVTYGKGVITAHMNSTSGTEVAAPTIRFGDYQKSLEACFSDKELALIENGSHAVVNLDFHMVDSIEDAYEHEQFRKAIAFEEKTYGTLHEGVFIEVEASRSVDGKEYTEFDSLFENVEIQIDVPLYLCAENRQFYIMNSDKGECVLSGDVDQEADTLSISTHELTTALLLYQDHDEMLKKITNRLQIKSQYIIAGGIALLVLVWFILDRRHK